jgi:hypothetical protein
MSTYYEEGIKALARKPKVEKPVAPKHPISAAKVIVSVVATAEEGAKAVKNGVKKGFVTSVGFIVKSARDAKAGAQLLVEEIKKEHTAAKVKTATR